MNLKTTLSLFALVASAGAQDLRHAVVVADLVVTGSVVSVRPIGKDFVVHRLRIDETLSGKAPAAVSIVERKRVSQHQRPAPAVRRIYCLHEIENAAAMGLPASLAPFFEMHGAAGCNPTLSGAADPLLELARAVTAAERGDASAAATKAIMLRLALRGRGQVRIEATRALSERRALLKALSPIDLSAVQSRAIGETEDVDYKIELAMLCAEREVQGLVDALCLGVDAVRDARYAKAIGRIAGKLHGEKAADILRRHIARPQRPEARGSLIIALGATSTEGALDALLRLRRGAGADKFVDAALRIHGSPRALAVLEKDAKPAVGKGK